MVILRRPALHDYVAAFELRIVYDPQILKRPRPFVSKRQDSRIDRILHHAADGCSTPVWFAFLGFDSPVIQVLRYAVRTVAFFCQQVVDLPDHCSLRFIDDQIPDGLVLFVGSAQVLQPVTVGQVPAAPLAFLHHLGMLCADSDGCFFAFSGSLPETNVVQQFIHMIVKALFTLPGTPDFNALLHKPLNYERGLIIPAAQSIEHEDQEDIELMPHCPFFDLHDSISGIRTDLVSGNAFFRNFIDNLPIRVSRCIFPAGKLLHGNVIVIHLSDGGNTV